MPPVHAVNLKANSGNAAFWVERIRSAYRILLSPEEKIIEEDN